MWLKRRLPVFRLGLPVWLIEWEANHRRLGGLLAQVRMLKQFIHRCDAFFRIFDMLIVINGVLLRLKFIGLFTRLAKRFDNGVTLPADRLQSKVEVVVMDRSN